MVTETTDAERLLYEEPIVKLFSKPSVVRILTVLNDAAGGALTPDDIAEQADVTKPSIYNNVGLLEDSGLVEKTRLGNGMALKMDMSDGAVQAFMQLRDEVIDQQS